ncbi:MAG: hypothetical protein JWP43_3446 [Ramlibacter sp.]|jgi:exonuclease VII small subunit|nr:hypothetical protein [Ramlibacter sp.]
MSTEILTRFDEFESSWEEATRTLERRELALGEAMRAYRQHRQVCTTSRVAEALARHEEAKEAVDSLMHAIWAKLF